ncbi:MAG: hypothetical protein HOQ24_18810, partial [Mycobacteriaceae bacterium]|nr:hypothetical protein [Mycobacteriaceae bacterium]
HGDSGDPGGSGDNNGGNQGGNHQDPVGGDKDPAGGGGWDDPPAPPPEAGAAPDPGDDHWPATGVEPTEAQHLAAESALQRLQGDGLHTRLFTVDEAVVTAHDQAARVAQWYAGLADDPEARTGLMLEHTELLGNLDGIPEHVRDQANRLTLLRALEPLEQSHVLDLEHEGQLANCTAVRDLVRDADRNAAALPGAPRARLLSLQISKPTLAPHTLELVFGKHDSAPTAAVHLLPSGASIAEVRAAAPDAFKHFANLQRTDPGEVSLTVRMRAEPLLAAQPEGGEQTVGIGRLTESDGRRLLSDLSGRDAAWRVANPGQTRQVHLVVHGESGTVVGYAGRHGRLAAAGVDRLTYWRCTDAGPLDHSGELGVRVFADPAGAAPNSLPGESAHVHPTSDAFGAHHPSDRAGASTELTPQQLAEITRGEHDPTTHPDAGERTRMLGERITDGPHSSRPADAHSLAYSTAEAYHALRQQGLSDAEILNALRSGGTPMLADAAGLPWYARDEMHQLAARGADEDRIAAGNRALEHEEITPEYLFDQEVCQLEDLAAGLPGHPPLRVLERGPDGAPTLVAIGHDRPEKVVVYAADAGRDLLSHGDVVGALYRDTVARAAEQNGRVPSVAVVVAVHGADGGPALARQIASLAGELDFHAQRTGSPLELHVIGEGEGATALSRAADGGDLTHYVESLTFIDPGEVASRAADYQIQDNRVHISSRSHVHDSTGSPAHPAFAPEWGARWVDLDALGQVGAGLSVPESFRVPAVEGEPTGARIQRAIDGAVGWVTDKMSNDNWGNEAHFRDVEMILAEVMGAGLAFGDLTVQCEVVHPEDGSGRTLRLTVLDADPTMKLYEAGHLDASEVGRDLWVTGLLAGEVTFGSHDKGRALQIDLPESRTSPAHVPPVDVPIRKTLPDGPADRDPNLALELERQFDAVAEDRLDARRATNLYAPERLAAEAAAQAGAYHDLSWNERAILAGNDPGFGETVLGVPPAWRDRQARLHLKAALDAFHERERSATLSPDERADRAAMQTLVRSLNHIDQTAAALGVEAHLLRFNPRDGYVEVALGNVGWASHVNVFSATGMPLRMLGLTMDCVADSHQAAPGGHTASLLQFNVREGAKADAFQRQGISDLLEMRRFYSTLPDGIPDIEVLNPQGTIDREVLQGHIGYVDLSARLGMHDDNGPLPAVGEGSADYVVPEAVQERRRQWNHLLEGRPSDSGSIALRLLDAWTPDGAVDVGGLLHRDGPMSAREWAQRAGANPHPGGFESKAAAAAHLQGRPGSYLVTFTDHPDGARVQFMRNSRGQIQTLDVRDIPRYEFGAGAQLEANVEHLWRRHETSSSSADSGRVYALAFSREGFGDLVPERPVSETGGEVMGLVGRDLPTDWVGGHPTDDITVPGARGHHLDGPDTLRHLVDPSSANACAVDGLGTLARLTNNPDVTPFEGQQAQQARAAGVDGGVFATRAAGDWHEGGFPDLDTAARRVRDEGVMIAVAVEFHGLAELNNGVGSHLAVMYREGGDVWIRETVNGQEMPPYRHEFGRQRSEDVSGVYGIVYKPEQHVDGSTVYRAETPLQDGVSRAVAGESRPDSLMGARFGRDRGEGDFTAPSRVPDHEAMPRGDPDPVNASMSAEEIQATRRKNSAAVLLARAGYDVIRRPELIATDYVHAARSGPPDFRIEGKLFDYYSSTSRSLHEVVEEVRTQVLQRRADRVVLDLVNSPFSVEQVRDVLRESGVRGLDEVIGVKDGAVHRVLPPPDREGITRWLRKRVTQTVETFLPPDYSTPDVVRSLADAALQVARGKVADLTRITGRSLEGLATAETLQRLRFLRISESDFHSFRSRLREGFERLPDVEPTDSRSRVLRLADRRSLSMAMLDLSVPERQALLSQHLDGYKSERQIADDMHVTVDDVRSLAETALHRVVDTLLADVRRMPEAQFRTFVSRLAADFDSLPNVTTDDPRAAALRRADRRSLSDALLELTPEQRHSLLAQHLDGYRGEREVAADLNIGVRDVRALADGALLLVGDRLSADVRRMADVDLRLLRTSLGDAFRDLPDIDPTDSRIAALRRADRNRLSEALSTLSPQERQVLLALHPGTGRTDAQIAAALNMPEHDVRPLAEEALHQTAHHLVPNPDVDPALRPVVGELRQMGIQVVGHEGVTLEYLTSVAEGLKAQFVESSNLNIARISFKDLGTRFSLAREITPGSGRMELVFNVTDATKPQAFRDRVRAYIEAGQFPPEFAEDTPRQLAVREAGSCLVAAGGGAAIDRVPRALTEYYDHMGGDPALYEQWLRDGLWGNSFRDGEFNPEQALADGYASYNWHRDDHPSEPVRVIHAVIGEAAHWTETAHLHPDALDYTPTGESPTRQQLDWGYGPAETEGLLPRQYFPSEKEAANVLHAERVRGRLQHELFPREGHEGWPYVDQRRDIRDLVEDVLRDYGDTIDVDYRVEAGGSGPPRLVLRFSEVLERTAGDGPLTASGERRPLIDAIGEHVLHHRADPIDAHHVEVEFHAPDHADSRLRVEQVDIVDGDPTQVAEARRKIRELLERYDWPNDQIRAADLLVLEAVTNAHQHGVGKIDVTAELRGDLQDGSRSVHLRIRDGDNKLPVVHHRDDLVVDQTEHNLGTRVMAGLANRYGIELHSTGKTLWFDLTREPSDVHESAGLSSVGRHSPEALDFLARLHIADVLANVDSSGRKIHYPWFDENIGTVVREVLPLHPELAKVMASREFLEDALFRPDRRRQGTSLESTMDLDALTKQIDAVKVVVDLLDLPDSIKWIGDAARELAEGDPHMLAEEVYQQRTVELSEELQGILDRVNERTKVFAEPDMAHHRRQPALPEGHQLNREPGLRGPGSAHIEWQHSLWRKHQNLLEAVGHDAATANNRGGVMAVREQAKPEGS